MQLLKVTYLWVFLLVFINGKAHATKNSTESKKYHVKHSFSDQKVDVTINRDDSNENSEFKRRRKSRCVEVGVPVISSVCFKQIFIYRTFKPHWVDDIYLSSLYHVAHKRGPPSR